MNNMSNITFADSFADSLQVMENEMTRMASDSTHHNGIMIGMIIGLIIAVIAVCITIIIYNHEMRSIRKAHALWKYARGKMEVAWVGMIDICRECIEGDLRAINAAAAVFKEFPTYDEERRGKEMEHFPNVANLCEGIVSDRTSVMESLHTLVDRDLQYIDKEMAAIEKEYPKETTEYNKDHADRYPHNTNH